MDDMKTAVQATCSRAWSWLEEHLQHLVFGGGEGANSTVSSPGWESRGWRSPARIWEEKGRWKPCKEEPGGKKDRDHNSTPFLLTFWFLPLVCQVRTKRGYHDFFLIFRFFFKFWSFKFRFFEFLNFWNVFFKFWKFWFKKKIIFLKFWKFWKFGFF